MEYCMIIYTVIDNIMYTVGGILDMHLSYHVYGSPQKQQIEIFRSQDCVSGGSQLRTEMKERGQNLEVGRVGACQGDNVHVPVQ